MAALLQDIRFGLRTLLKSPGFTAVALLTLTLGIGVNTAIFSVVNAVLLRALPFRDPDRLVMVWEDATKTGFPRDTPAPANYNDWKAQKQIFDDTAAVAWQVSNLTGDGEPEKLEGQRASRNLFSVLGVQPVLGRVFTEDEDKPGSDVVLISYGLWKRRFGADPKLVGRTILLDGEKRTVVGIMPSGFSFPPTDFTSEKGTDIWMPAAFTPRELARRNSHYLEVVARLRPGVSIEQANAGLSVLHKRLLAQFPDDEAFIERFLAEPLQVSYTRDVRRGLVVLLVAVGCILLIACANIANLMLSRATGRSREFAVRTAIGAGRWRIVRQLLTESLMMSLAGCVLGLLLAEWCFVFLKNLVPQDLSQTVRLDLDWRVLGFAAFASIVSTVLFGLAPAIQASRLDLNDVLKEGGRSGIGSHRRGLRNALVVAEVALSLVLLIGAMLLIRSFANLRGFDPGFRADHVLSMRLNIARTKYGEFDKRSEFFDRILERVRALPGVKSAGLTSALPLTWKGGTNGFTAEGRPARKGEIHDAADRVISPGYFDAMRIRMISGRPFDEGDREHSLPVGIINETMARQFWPNEDPIGKRFRFSDKGPWSTIVGVSGDVRQMGLDEPVKAEMYFPYWQGKDNWMVPRDLVIRTSGDPLLLAGTVRQAIWQVDRDQPISNIQTLDDLLDNEVAPRRVQVTMLGAFAALALALACIGIYGVLSYAVAARTQEIGVRVALGAASKDIWRSVAGQGMALAGLGIAIGIAVASILTRLLSSLLFGVSPGDPPTYAGAALVFAFVALLASYIPAHRASRVDPMVALRYE